MYYEFMDLFLKKIFRIYIVIDTHLMNNSKREINTPDKQYMVKSFKEIT